MFRFWTVQHKSVLDAVEMNGYYQADISKSPFVIQNPPLEELYRFLLDSFNKTNEFRLNFRLCLSKRFPNLFFPKHS